MKITVFTTSGLKSKGYYVFRRLFPYQSISKKPSARSHRIGINQQNVLFEFSLQPQTKMLEKPIAIPSTLFSRII